MFCSSCGKKITENSKFCKYCGSFQKKQKTNFLKIFIVTGILFLILIVAVIYLYLNENETTQQKLNWEFVLPTVIITPTKTPVKTKTSNTVDNTVNNNVNNSDPWGVAKQIDEHTWTMKVGSDPAMATMNEILSALNEYRNKNGSQKLTLDPKLTSYAQTRADFFYSNKNLDGHSGFNDFLNNQDGFNKLGFNWLGENASYGYKLNGVHLVEWIYGGDEPHDKNQLDTKWDHVGIGIKGTSTCIIFGTGKM